MSFIIFMKKKTMPGNSGSFHLFEIYKDSAALDFHRNTSHYKNYRSKIEELLEKPIEVKIVNFYRFNLINIINNMFAYFILSSNFPKQNNKTSHFYGCFLIN